MQPLVVDLFEQVEVVFAFRTVDKAFAGALFHDEGQDDANNYAYQDGDADAFVCFEDKVVKRVEIHGSPLWLSGHELLVEYTVRFRGAPVVDAPRFQNI